MYRASITVTSMMLQPTGYYCTVCIVSDIATSGSCMLFLTIMPSYTNREGKDVWVYIDDQHGIPLHYHYYVTKTLLCMWLHDNKTPGSHV